MNNKHPGKFLKELYVDKCNFPVKIIAWKLDISKTTLDKVFEGKQNISFDLALRLAKTFETDVYYYVSLQMKYDFNKAKEKTDLSRVRSMYKRPDKE